MMFFVNSSSSNGYRWTGDGFHVLAILILLIKFWVTRSSSGVSGRTQALLAATYTLRYMDLWGMWIWVSYYNTLMKVFYIGVSFLIVYLTYCTFKTTYEKEFDTFRCELVVIPVTLLAFFLNYAHTMDEIAWTWSIYMESVALLPQIFMIWKAGKSEFYIIVYMMFMALYRGFYIANWVYRFNADGHYDIISIVGGVSETSIGFLGFLCVVSQMLVNIPTRGIKKQSIYVIPLIPGELDQRKIKVKQQQNPVLNV